MNKIELGVTTSRFHLHNVLILNKIKDLNIIIIFSVGEKLRYYLQSKRDPHRHSSPIFMNCCAKRYCRHIASKMF